MNLRSRGFLFLIEDRSHRCAKFKIFRRGGRWREVFQFTFDKTGGARPAEPDTSTPERRQEWNVGDDAADVGVLNFAPLEHHPGTYGVDYLYHLGQHGVIVRRD